jgi:hypothetical protein
MSAFSFVYISEILNIFCPSTSEGEQNIFLRGKCEEEKRANSQGNRNLNGKMYAKEKNRGEKGSLMIQGMLMVG